jgi:hypothetical protein
MSQSERIQTPRQNKEVNPLQASLEEENNQLRKQVLTIFLGPNFTSYVKLRQNIRKQRPFWSRKLST